MEMQENTLSEKPISNEVNDQIWDIDEPSFDEAFGTGNDPDPVFNVIEKKKTESEGVKPDMKKELQDLDEDDEESIPSESVDFNPDEIESSENPVSETEEETTEEEEGENEFSIFAKMLAEKELLDINEEEFEASEEGLMNAFAGTIEARVKEEIDMFQRSLPSEGKELLKHMMEGGSIADFKESYGTPDYENISIEENENNQKWIIAEFMRLRGDSAEEIQETIEDYADLGKLEKQAEKAKERLALYAKKQKENLAIRREEEKKAKEQQRQEVLTNISSLVEESEEIKGFPLTRKAKKDLLTYMTEPTVKIDSPQGPQYVTQYQADEMKASQNLEDFVLKAYLRMTNYNLDPVKKKSESNLSSKLREQLQHSKSKTGTQAKFGGGKKPATSSKGSDWDL